jgi:hypothetical protein
MALDPKQVIQKNVPLVVCYVAAIVPVVLWVVMVQMGVKGGRLNSFQQMATMLRGKIAMFRSLSDEINQDKTKVPNADVKKQEDDRTETLKKQYETMVHLIGDRDAELEKWFSDVPVPPGQKEPAMNDFKTKLNSEMERLKKEFKEIVTDPGPTASVFISLEDPSAGALKKSQKQFWILNRLLDALKKGGTVAANAPPNAEPPVRLIAPVEFQTANTVGSGGNSKELPKMAPIPVKIVVQMSFRDVPKVLREILAQPIVFRLRSLHTELLPFSFTRPDLSLTVNADPKILYEQTIYTASLAGADKQPKGSDGEESVLPEPKLKVTFELDAIDFDMDVLVPQAAQPAAGSGK